MIDAIASNHTNAHCCGVAKFNHRLAQELGLPLVSLASAFQKACPLLSIKGSEIPDMYAYAWYGPKRYHLLAHDRQIPDWLLNGAERVLYADSDVWCPSTVPVADLRPMTRILTFGMAHKLAQASYEKLRDLLDAHGDYAIGVSVAIHEGTDWAECFQSVSDELTRVFGAKAHLFGSLADAGLSATLQSCTAMAAFFPQGVRANNTTVWAALEHGVPVITNLDAQSPRGFVHGFNVFDINELTEFPNRSMLSVVAHKGRLLAEKYSWAELVKCLA